MTALLACPTCDSVIIFPGRYSGTADTCPNCGHPVTIPADKPSTEALMQLAHQIREEAKRITRYQGNNNTRMDKR